MLEAQWRSLLDEDQQEREEIVVDFNEPKMTCPACMTTFDTGPRECPDCGLFLG